MFTNKDNIHDVFAIWLASDDYEGVNDGQSLSVTTLLKSTRQIILSQRVNPGIGTGDISQFIPSRFGTAIHEAIEKAWLNEPEKAMQSLGYPPQAIEKLRVNPEEDDPDYLNVYMEQRVSREFMGLIINGAYDYIFDGQLCDVKTTGTYGYVKGNKDEDYILQLSLYRWLNPDKVHEEFGTILFVFTDWSKLGYIKDKKRYPPLRLMDKDYPLMGESAVQNYLRNKINDLRSYWDSNEADLPTCTPKDLWQDEPVYKYYKDPAKRSRSQGNFDTPFEAEQKRRENGGIGIIVPVYGQPKACLWCPAQAICSQAQGYIASGKLTL